MGTGALDSTLMDPNASARALSTGMSTRVPGLASMDPSEDARDLDTNIEVSSIGTKVIGPVSMAWASRT